MAFKPAADIFRFLGFSGWAWGRLCAAHLALCAAAILARPALLMVWRVWGPAGLIPAAAALGLPGPR